MILILKYRFLVLFLAVFATGKAQTVSETFDSAKVCFQQTNYERTCALLKRINYFDPAFKPDSVSLLLARSYRQMQKYTLANNYYEALTDSSLALERAVCLCLDNRFEEAKYQLTFCKNDSLQNSLRYFILGTIAMHKDSIELASKCFIKMSAGNDSLTLYISQSSARIQSLESKKLLAYQIANACLPGLGFFIMKQPTKGFQALAVTSFFAAAFVYTAVYFSVIDASIAIAPWLMRYYIGQIKRVRKTIDEEIANRKAELYAQVLHCQKAQIGIGFN